MSRCVAEWTCQGDRAFSWGVMYAITLCLCVSPMSANSAGSPDPFLFSSAISPDGVWVAENFGTDGCCSGGFVVIHKTSEPSLPSDATIFSASTAPSLFMIWQDDKTLSLVQDSNDEPVKGPVTYRGVTIVYSTYQNRINDNHTFDVANIAKKDLSIKEADVSAEAVDQTTKTGRRCGLSISASDGTLYDKIGMRVEASINRCNRASNCAGISSQFWIGKRIDDQRGTALTAATVSDIPSANRGPHGNQNDAVSGQFNGNSAVDLMSALSSGSLEIQYALNFFDTIVSYHIATTRLAGAIDSFRACVGDADFNWLMNKKPEPTRSGVPWRLR